MKLLLVAFLVPLAVALRHTRATEVHNVPSNYTVLQRHVAFFDRNNDGVIYPEETIQGLQAVGLSYGAATACSSAFHIVPSFQTRPGDLPSPLLPVEIANVARAEHGSETGAFDNHGNFVESKFEEIFSKYARTHPNALTLDEIDEMLMANKDPLDILGFTASNVEWRLLYDIAKDEDGLLQKEAIRGVYDGSLFYNLAKQHDGPL